MRENSASQRDKKPEDGADSVWRLIRFACKPGFEDVIVSCIFESGFSGLEEQSTEGRIFLEAYYASSPGMLNPLDQFREKIAALPASGGEPLYEIVSMENLPDDNWETEWMRGLEPVEVGSRLVVRPSWTTYANRDNRIEIIVDPKMAFGTGSHPTTQLCLNVFEEFNLEGKTVIDAGFGSGILSIAAIKFGARSVFGFDKDPFSLKNARENIRTNGVEEHITLVEADLGTVRAEPADFVFANMISGALLPNLTLFHGFLKQGGRVLFSGLLAEEEKIFTESLVSKGFRVELVWRSEEWIAVMGSSEKGRL